MSRAARIFKTKRAGFAVLCVGVAGLAAVPSGAAPVRTGAAATVSKVAKGIVKLGAGTIKACGKNATPTVNYNLDLGFPATTSAQVQKGLSELVKFGMREDVEGASSGFLYVDMKPTLTIDANINTKCEGQESVELISKETVKVVPVFDVPVPVTIIATLSLDLGIKAPVGVNVKGRLTGGLQSGVVVINNQVKRCGKNEAFGCEYRPALQVQTFNPVTWAPEVTSLSSRVQPRSARPDLTWTTDSLVLDPTSSATVTAELRLDVAFLIGTIAGPAIAAHGGIGADFTACPSATVPAWQLRAIAGIGVSLRAAEWATEAVDQWFEENPTADEVVSALTGFFSENYPDWIPETEFDFPVVDRVVATAPAGTTWPAIRCPGTSTTPTVTPSTKATVAPTPTLTPTVPATKPGVSTPTTPPTTPRTTPTAPPAVGTVPAPVSTLINGCTDDFSGALRIRLDASDPVCQATETPLVWHVGRAVAVPGGREANRLQVCVDGNGIASVPPGRWRTGSTLNCPGARTWRLVGAAAGEISDPGIESVCVSSTAVRVSTTCRADERPLRFFVDGPAA